MLTFQERINFFRNGILAYQELNKVLDEIIILINKNVKKTYKSEKLKDNFNYMMQFFIFDYLSWPKQNEHFFFRELLYIVDIGNLNKRLDFAVNKEKDQLFFLMIAEKSSNNKEVLHFRKKIKNFISKIKKDVFKVFSIFDDLSKKEKVYDKIIILLATVLENFLNLEKKIDNKNITSKIVKDVKTFFFNMNKFNVNK